MGMGMNSRGKIAVTWLMIVLAAALVSACRDSDNAANAEIEPRDQRVVPVSVMKVQPAPIRDVLVLPGETEAWQDVRVAADTAGRVELVSACEGDQVQKGELLAKIDVSALKAQLDRAEAAFRLAEELYQRRKLLFERNIIPQEELDRSQTERDLARADLQQIRVRYDHGFPKSPINGVVNVCYVDAGEFIDTGKPIVDIVNIDKIKINVDVPEMDVRYIQRGQKTPVSIDALPGLPFAGTIDFVAFKADPVTKTFQVRTVVDNEEHRIRPGMIARVAFLRQVVPDAIAAPLFALVDKGGERILYVEDNGVVQSRNISIGVIEGDRVQITSGLNAGDHLIIKGQTEVEDGMRVVVQ
jgi:membrane fusion protein (multidrug efflux system)